MPCLHSFPSALDLRVNEQELVLMVAHLALILCQLGKTFVCSTSFNIQNNSEIHKKLFYFVNDRTEVLSN